MKHGFAAASRPAKKLQNPGFVIEKEPRGERFLLTPDA
jgi:hypothetical protein